VPATPAPAPRPPEGQQRQFARASYLTPARIIRENGAALDGRTEDLSEGGLLVMCPNALEQGEVVSLRFALPIDGRMVTVPTRVRWVRNVPNRAANGLEFIDLDPAIRAEIARYVSIMRST